jgi:hypothetical protein
MQAFNYIKRSGARIRVIRGRVLSRDQGLAVERLALIRGRTLVIRFGDRWLFVGDSPFLPLSILLFTLAKLLL